MKTQTININGSDFTIEQLTKLIEDSKNISPMNEVYAYHNTTEDKFEEDYKNIPLHLKYYQKVVMIVAFYNKGWIPNLKNKSEKKWYCWFYFEPFSLNDVDYCYGNTGAPAALLLQKEEYCRDMVEKFLPELEMCYTTLNK